VSGDRLFAFVQLEFGFLLGPGDGRYLRRAAPEAEPEGVIVLRTLGAPERRRLRGRRPRAVEEAEPEPVPTARATLIRAEPFAAQAAAARWLDELRGDRERLEAAVATAVRELNALLRAHRAAALDPYARDVAAEHALVVRVGYGSGEQVADGRFGAAVEVPREGSRGKRADRLTPQERLAAVLGGRERVLAGEELLLRARADIDAGRPREAALQARIALEALAAELPDAEALAEWRRDVGRAANEALEGDPDGSLQEAVADAVAAMERVLRRHRARRSGNS
jgi:hypothetical protein